MRMQSFQPAPRQWSVNNGPLVVLGQHKKHEGKCVFQTYDAPSLTTYSTHETGPPGGSGPPCETGPPAGSGPPGGSGRPSGTGPPCGTGTPNGTGPPRFTGLLNGKSPPLITKLAELVKRTTKPQEKRNNQSHKRKEKMKNYKPISPIGLLIAGCLCMLQTTAVFAAAGDTVSNMATLNFNVGAGNIQLISSPTGNADVVGGGGPGAAGVATTFLEDRLINISVLAAGAAATVASSEVDGVLEFEVTNNGNGTQDILLAAVDQATGAYVIGADNLTPTSVQVFVDSAATGTSAADDYVLATDTGIWMNDLAPGTTRTAYIVTDFPVAADGDIAVVTLVAQVAGTDLVNNTETNAAHAAAAILNDDNSGASPIGTFSNGGVGPTVPAGAATNADFTATEQIVFNDPAGGTTDDEDSTGAAQDAAKNGQASDTNFYTVASAILTVTKAVGVAVFDPVNLAVSPKAIPGGYVPYTITIANTGTGSAFLTTITDTLDALVALDPDFTSDGGTTFASGFATFTYEIDTSGTGRLGPGAPGDEVGAAGTYFCTDSNVADSDGCTDSGGAGAAITITFDGSGGNTLPGMDVNTTNGGYIAGELKGGETVVIRYQAIVQ